MNTWLSSNPESLIENTEVYIKILSYGKENAIKSERLWRRYKDAGGKMGLAIFRRKLRHLSQNARANGHKVIGDSNGYYIAKTNEEWNIFKKTQSNHIKTLLQTFAKCEGKTMNETIREVIFGEKEKETDVKELTLFG